MIELTQDDLEFTESAEFPNSQIRFNILSAAERLETRNLQIYQEPKFVKLSTVDFLKATYSWKLKTMYQGDLANYLTPYVFKRIVQFEGDKRSDMAIGDWMRQIAKKIELSTADVETKKSLDAATKAQIARAATALEDTSLEQIYTGVDAMGDKGSALGVLLDLVKVNSSNKRNERSAKDHENHDIAIQKLHSLLSPYIVGRIRTLNDFERLSFKEIACWLRLFLAE